MNQDYTRDEPCCVGVQTPTLLGDLSEKVGYIFENVLKLQDSNERLQACVCPTPKSIPKEGKTEPLDYSLVGLINQLEAINKFFCEENTKYQEILYKLK